LRLSKKSTDDWRRRIAHRPRVGTHCRGWRRRMS
jgi:hypothetical protein